MVKTEGKKDWVHLTKWKEITEQEWRENRVFKTDEVRKVVEVIIEQVRKGGDKALKELTEKFDKTKLKRIAVSRDEIDEAYATVDPLIEEELENAAFNIERFHRMQLPPDMWTSEVEPGITLGVKSTPLVRVGCYISGGLASYPSTVLMTVVAAKTAGVGEVICCTPAPVNPITLVALDIAGCDEIYTVGGAQAIAAMALGTESIEPVQKVVGPGNRFVTEAKTLLQNICSIDFPAGPAGPPSLRIPPLFPNSSYPISLLKENAGLFPLSCSLPTTPPFPTVSGTAWRSRWRRSPKRTSSRRPC